MALADKAAPYISTPNGEAPLRHAAAYASIDCDVEHLRGRSVLVRTRKQLSAALALIELDGVAQRVVICPPDFDAAHLDDVILRAKINLIAYDDATLTVGADLIPRVAIHLPDVERPRLREANTVATEWVMFTSGTTGAPKMAVHSLAGLTGAIKPTTGDAAPVWGTFYDIRRYGGLQILFRALVGGASMVLSDSEDSPANFLQRLAKHGVTALSGTPSHWRRALISPARAVINPKYVRLSGEIADQAVLDGLKAAYPGASVGHAYASTEAGVGFEVTDGLEGFPAAFVNNTDGPVEMRVVDGALQLRSNRSASGYVGNAPVREADGFVDSGDMVELRGDRYHFVGRRGGVINVGGLKVHPEEIEAVINRYPGVRASLVRGRKNPITGAVVVADIVLADEDGPADEIKAREIKEGVMAACRSSLAPFKVPAIVRVAEALDMSPSGKLLRAHG
jgi:acyl-coenzyme A synthetase/AMP-(fatty) acid ligase